MPRIVEFEATFKAALKLSLEQWAQRQAGTLGEEPPFKRGHRVELLQQAIAPLRKTLPRGQFKRLAQALSLPTGSKCSLSSRTSGASSYDEMQNVAQWTAARPGARRAVSEAAAAKRKQQGKSRAARRR